jgi:hypothetical protein
MKLSTIAAVAIIAAVVAVRATIEAAGILAALIGVLIGLESLESQTETVEPPVLMALPDARLSVVELRTLARHRLGSSVKINGRRIAQATRADLLAALGAA